MRHSVSISLPEGIFGQLRSHCRRDHANGSEIVRRALREYFFKAEFDRLHRKISLEAAKRGIRLTEEEIFRQIS